MLSLCVMNPKERNSAGQLGTRSEKVPPGQVRTGMKTKTAPAATPAAIQGDRMKTVVVKPEFAGLTEEQVIDAIDAYEAQVDEYYANKGDEEECGCGCSHDDEGSCEDSDDDVIPSDDPIVLEVERLIAAYSDRFDELCKENGEVPEEALTYKPRTPIEQVAFDIFTDALHDSLMDEDDE